MAVHRLWASLSAALLASCAIWRYSVSESVAIGDGEDAMVLLRSPRSDACAAHNLQLVADAAALPTASHCLQHRDGPLPLHHRSPEPWLPQLQRAGDAQSFPELRKLLSGRDMPPVDDALERVLADYARLHADIVSGRRPWRVWIVDCAGFRRCGGLGDRVKGVRACVRASHRRRASPRCTATLAHCCCAVLSACAAALAVLPQRGVAAGVADPGLAGAVAAGYVRGERRCCTGAAR